MFCLFHPSCSTILSRTCSFVTKSQSCLNVHHSWKSSFLYSCSTTVNSRLLLTQFQVQCYSKKPGGVSSSSHKKKTDPEPLMKDDKEAFFIVRKGDIVGVYKSLSDCPAQAGTLIFDPPVSVYKGCSMPKDTEKHLLSRGLKNAVYTIRASDLTIDLLGTLVAYPLQQSCVLEFDGSSKGNPGQAGAGAILRSDDGTLICRLRQGLGKATCNVAEYTGVILGLKHALGKGFTNVLVRGDSKLVCLQIEGKWRAKKPHISTLCEEAKTLKDRFISFQIMHIKRDLNSEADAQANLATKLAEGEIQEETDE